MPLAIVTFLLCVATHAATAQIHYDPYFVLPRAVGTLGLTLGSDATDLSAPTASTTSFAVAKYKVSDRLETGLRADLGWWESKRSDLSALHVGLKYALREASALSLNALLPTADTSDPGFSVGLMHARLISGNIYINNWLQLGLLKGYSDAGGRIDWLVESLYVFNERVFAFLALDTTLQTDRFADTLALTLRPNLDYMLTPALALNAGLSLGLAGSARQDQAGFFLALFWERAGK